MENGIIRRVIGPVVDVQFPSGKLPDIYNAIEVNLDDHKIVMEAVQHIGDNSVRCISLFSTDGLSRGCPAVDTGAPIKMPVGEATLGRMFNVVGEPIDGKGEIKADGYRPVEQPAPSIVDRQSVVVQVNDLTAEHQALHSLALVQLDIGLAGVDSCLDIAVAGAVPVNCSTLTGVKCTEEVKDRLFLLSRQGAGTIGGLGALRGTGNVKGIVIPEVAGA